MKKEAVILAGGRGTRLKSVVSEVPKPMAMIAGKPFLYYLLLRLSQAKYTDVVLSVGYKSEVIIKHFGREFRKMKLSYALENQPLGTGGGIRLAEEQINSEAYTLLNGDSLLLIDLEDMQRSYEHHHPDVMLGAKKLKQADRYGTLQLQGNRINAFHEKDPGVLEGWINAGVYMMKKGLLMQSVGEAFSFEKEFLQSKCSDFVMEIYPTDAYFIDIGIPEDYQKAQHEFPALFNQ